MKIDSIKLMNYRQYRNEEIKFATSENQNFTIIQGVTGAGKTNLLNAITWCLYGKEKHLEQKYKGLPLVNTATLNELELGGKCKVGVLIQMRDEEGKKLIVGRSLKFQKLKDSKLIMAPESLSKSRDGSTFEMVQQINNDMVEIVLPQRSGNIIMLESRTKKRRQEWEKGGSVLKRNLH